MNDDFPPEGKGGGATIVASLARGYMKAGHEVLVLTTHQDDTRDKIRVHADGYRVTSLYLKYRPSLRPYLSVWNHAAAVKVKAALRTLGPFDIVHAHNVHGWLTYNALTLAKRHAAKLVVTFHDVMSVSYGRLATECYLKSGPDRFDIRLSVVDHLHQAGITYNPLRNMLIRRKLRRADARVAVSVALRDVLVGNGVPVDEVIHNGIDVQDVRVPQDIHEELRQKLRLTDQRLIFFGGRLSRDKGLRQLLLAYEPIRERHPNVLILVVGDENRARSLLKDIPDPLRPHLRITGWLERHQLLSVLSLSEICVTPSVCFDSFPTVNIEAMSLGKPVIATHFGGSRELVVDGETGFIVNPFDAKTFSDRLGQLLVDPALGKRMGAAGKELVLRSFTLAGQIDEYLRLFERLTEATDRDR